MKFVDFAHIHVKAGDGGVGCVSFRREKFVPKGGPDGGNGGRGGSILLRANRHLATLLDFQYKRIYRAPRGEHGLGANKAGKSGSNIFIDVPVGTLVRNQVTGQLISDLVEDGAEIVLARGGKGGRGNGEFATATNQSPREYEHGGEGEEFDVELELKLLADVGLVGLPNAGKSTLISVISAARPKIADYPFTTLVPNLGIVRIDIGKSFVVADVPGLIEGAHTGKGLGIQFLRHIERTRLIVFLLDCTSIDIKTDYRMLTNELKLYKKELIRKPKLIAVTKIDSIEAGELKKLKTVKFGTVPVFFISAVSGKGVPELVKGMWKAIA